MSKKQQKTFELTIWGPNDAKPPVESLGATGTQAAADYRYLYDQEEKKFKLGDGQMVLKFLLDGKSAKYYEFRWINATNLNEAEANGIRLHMTKMKDSQVKLTIDNSDRLPDGSKVTTGSIYFTVWIEDTRTGDHFICDPSVDIEA